jgi:hypothetical protein
MKKLFISLVVIFAFSVCAWSQQTTESQVVTPAKTVQSVDKSSLTKKTIVSPKPPTNWSRIKDLFR